MRRSALPELRQRLAADAIEYIKKPLRHDEVIWDRHLTALFHNAVVRQRVDPGGNWAAAPLYPPFKRDLRPKQPFGCPR